MYIYTALQIDYFRVSDPDTVGSDQVFFLDPDLFCSVDPDPEKKR